MMMVMMMMMMIVIKPGHSQTWDSSGCCLNSGFLAASGVILEDCLNPLRKFEGMLYVCYC